MEAEIITIGDELLLGQTIDTNSAWIGMNLSPEGLRISRKTCVPDRREDILAAIGQALHSSVRCFSVRSVITTRYHELSTLQSKVREYTIYLIV